MYVYRCIFRNWYWLGLDEIHVLHCTSDIRLNVIKALEILISVTVSFYFYVMVIVSSYVLGQVK
jgi:hypothetical protein